MCAPQPAYLIGFSDELQEQNLHLKKFLREHVYKHYKVQRMTSKARRVVRELFDGVHGRSEPDAR